MCLLYWLFLSTRYALDGATKRSLGLSAHSTHPTRQASARRIAHTTRRSLAVDDSSPKRLASVAPPSTIEAKILGGMPSLPRSLPSTSSSSIPHPLLIGCLIGVFGTLFVQGFIFIVCRVYLRNYGFKSKRKRLGLFGSSEARHIEQFTMSTSTSSLNGKTSLLRVANRNPDGSWSFTDTNRQSTQQTVSSPVLSPSNSLASTPWSPDSSTATSSLASPTYSRPLPTPPWSPATSTSGSTFNHKAPPPSAFPPALAQRSSRMDVVDCGSSARTGPPPYNTTTTTTPSPVPPIPREFLNIKGGHHRR